MPELPEVETISRELGRTLPGKRVSEVILSGLPLRRPLPEDFAPQLSGRTIRKIHRRGKYLVAEMQPRSFWLIHLGMSGRILYRRNPDGIEKHTHAVVRFTDGTELAYVDPRRFGLLRLYESGRLAEVPELRRLGKDPLAPGFDGDWLWSRLSRSRREIKSFLLDQHRIAGLGNIYVCEALFRAGIHPGRRCCGISRREAESLARAVRGVLRAAIRHRGTSFSDFLDSEGAPGGHQEFLQVFMREGERCRRCRSLIRRLRQGNRSSYYCPVCQDLGKESRSDG